MLPDQYEVYAYKGGLTTPGCNEIVNWNLAKTVLKINTKQLKFFKDRYV